MRKNALLWFMLIGLSTLFLFPFYWVLTSSVKSVEGFSMSPPSFYPSEYRKTDVAVLAPDGLVLSDGFRWVQLAQSPDVLNHSSGNGGYFVRLNDEGTPSQLVNWKPDSLTMQRTEPDTVLFAGIQVHRLEDENRTVGLLSRMIRPKEASFDELIFVVPDGSRVVDSSELLLNQKHTDIRDFAMRLENYPETLRGPEASMGQTESTGFLVFMRNSFIISLLAVLGQILSSSMVAFAFARLRFRGREILFVVLLATMMIPGQVTMIPMFTFFKEIGWVDTFLPLIVPHFTAGAFNVFLLRQYMLTIPKALDDSAAIDGCGPLRTFFLVILPNCVPVLIVVGLFTFVATWQDILGPLIYLDNPDLRTVTLGLEYFRSPYVDTRHLLMTGAVLAMLPVAILFIIFQKYIVAGIATTGMKT